LQTFSVGTDVKTDGVHSRGLAMKIRVFDDYHIKTIQFDGTGPPFHLHSGLHPTSMQLCSLVSGQLAEALCSEFPQENA
jgi:hypothetical protein